MFSPILIVLKIARAHGLFSKTGILCSLAIDLIFSAILSAPSDRYLFSSGLFMAGVNFYGAMALGVLVT